MVQSSFQALRNHTSQRKRIVAVRQIRRMVFQKIRQGVFMSQALAHMANPAVQAQIAAAGGSIPNLAAAAMTAEQEALKQTLEKAVAEATGILQGANAKAAELVATGNDLDRQVKKNKEAQADLARARQYFASTNNIFPLRKVALGLATPKDITAQFPDIDKIPDGWTPPAAPAAA